MPDNDIPRYSKIPMSYRTPDRELGGIPKEGTRTPTKPADRDKLKETNSIQTPPSFVPSRRLHHVITRINGDLEVL